MKISLLNARNAPDAGWDYVWGALKLVPDGLTCDRDTLMRRFFCPPLMSARLTLRAIFPAHGRPHCELGRYLFTPGSPEDPASRVLLHSHPIAVTGRVAFEAGREQVFAFGRAGGRLELELDGAAIFSVDDPQPGRTLSQIELSLPAGTVVMEATLECVECPAQSPPQLVCADNKTVHKRAHPGRQSYSLQVCLDFYDDLIPNAWNPQTFLRAMELYRRNHVQRVYFMDCAGYRSGLWQQPGCDREFPGFQRHIDQTYAEAGDFLPAAVRAAHAVGLPIYAVIKPYDAAFCFFFPEGTEDARKWGKIPRLGGPIWMAMDFIARHPHLRVERDMRGMPADLDERPVARIVLNSEHGLPHVLDPERIRLWESRNNGGYIPYSGPMVRRREGDHIILDGLDLRSRYFALTVEGAPTVSFGNVLRQLVEVQDAQGRPLPLTYATLTHPRGVKDMAQASFRFGHPSAVTSVIDDYLWLDGGQPLGIAKGWERYLWGAPCEAYDEVQDWWLRQVDDCIAAGVDGIDFRTLNHNRAFDWDVYGFNVPLVAAFRRRYGVDILNEPFDRAALRRLRGEFYTSFLRRARARLKQAGRGMHLHVSERMHPPEWHTEMEIHFDWPRWIAEGLADEITLKMPSMRCGPAPEAVSTARQHGLKVNFCSYLNGLDTDPNGREMVSCFVREAREGGADGFIMYENAAFMKSDGRGDVVLTCPWMVEAAAACARR